MASIDKQLKELNKIQDLQQRSQWMNILHPLGKLLLSVFYIIITVSFGKYDLVPLIIMSIYPIFGFILGELSFKDGLYRMRLILPLVLLVGIFNPFFDKNILFYIGGTAAETGAAVQGGFAVTGGMVSMVTLMLKGFYSALSAYILIATTSIDDICYALRCLHMPKMIVIVIMLIYRYFGVMGAEAERIITAYKLRAPSQKGIHYKAWGTLVGQWLLRSMDRAEDVYESMLLRGFKGDFFTSKKSYGLLDILYVIIWTMILVLIRSRVII
ncbi:cobalt ECF transporter T component CbiQ [Butyrivibrio proteoclasticus]|uniref:cobalt ECF transporter T component CbiQ n=1 Tax=Butyrivibrio proteoclasticus TaxID=43305 RepID=UPI000479FC5F|nr:cobalt ECF transporter T component CbiQ [Butyrivibrio proteoclasticus]